jgi:uncharacterized membrane protein
MRTRKPKEKAIHPAHTHGTEAGAIAGEVVGAVMGSMAGPPGVVAGMIVGAAAGALAGKVIDQEAERTSWHDGELDDAIGVTKGDLGRTVPPRKAP